MTFGQWLLKAMDGRGMTVKEFTWEFKIPGATVYAYQADHILPSPYRLRTILQHFIYNDQKVWELMQHFKQKKNGRPRKVRTASGTSPITASGAPSVAPSVTTHNKVQQQAAA